MTTEDFLYILIESFAHQDAGEFFKARQQLWHKKEKYSKKGFAEGLLKTFKWLYHQIQMPDRYRCRLKLPNDQITDEFVENEQKLQELKRKGEVSFPYQNFILVCTRLDNKAILILNSESIEELWRHLFRFLNPYCEEVQPPVLTSEDKSFPEEPLSLILVPESVSRYFQPIAEDDRIPVEISLPALVESTQTVNATLSEPGVKLTLRQAALILFYSGSAVTRENGDQLAQDFGYSSGEKLYQLFTRYSNNTDRRAPLETDLKTRNKIRLMEEILDYLPPKGKEAALKDIEILKGKIVEL